MRTALDSLGVHHGRISAKIDGPAPWRLLDTCERTQRVALPTSFAGEAVVRKAQSRRTRRLHVVVL